MKYAPDINLFKYVVTVFDKKKKRKKRETTHLVTDHENKVADNG